VKHELPLSAVVEETERQINTCHGGKYNGAECFKEPADRDVLNVVSWLG